MNQEVRDYLKALGKTDREISELTEPQLHAIRAMMQAMGTSIPAETQRMQQAEAAREKAEQKARQQGREERARKKGRFAMGFAIIPVVMVVVMLFSMLTTTLEERKPKDFDQAMEIAESYLAMGISHEQLVDQLVFEGVGKRDAKYTADNCGADWNRQAVLAAKDLRQRKSVSDQEVLDYLLLVGFTSEQAAYGVKNSK